MGASEWIALAALLVSVVGVLLNESRIRRERDAREREDRRRDEELNLLHQQVEGEAERRLEQRHAHLIGFQGSISGGDPTDEFTLSILNTGPDIAREVTAWVGDQTGAGISGPQRLGALPPNADRPQEFRIVVGRGASRGQREIALWASWIDGTGASKSPRACSARACGSSS
jgi:hypothetical protein